MKKLTLTICLTITLFMVSACEESTGYQKGYAAYESGDYATALREFKPLAEQGDADAQNSMGWMYQKGLGVPQDFKTALKWYTLAAEQGNAYAQYNLGHMYTNGKGVPQDNKTAVKWFRLAAKQGHPRAQEQVEFLRKK